MGLPLPKMSLESFLAWEETQVERHEFIAGEVFAMVGVRRINASVTLKLAAALDRALSGTRCQVFVESLKVQVADDKIFYPDIVVTCDPSDLAAESILKAPRVIVEVLSPSTQAYDRSLKFALYRGLDSLREYVLVDPDTRRIELFRRNAAGRFELHDRSDAEAIEFASIGCEVAVAEVFAGLEAPADRRPAEG